jgi:hypothetical protein
MFTAPAPLPDDPAIPQPLLLEAMAEIERLTLRIAGLERTRFGRRSEQLSDAALQRESEELEQSLAEQSAKLEAVAAAPLEGAYSVPGRRPRRTGHQYRRTSDAAGRIGTEERPVRRIR